MTRRRDFSAGRNLARFEFGGRERGNRRGTSRTLDAVPSRESTSRVAAIIQVPVCLPQWRDLTRRRGALKSKRARGEPVGRLTRGRSFRYRVQAPSEWEVSI
jgi:hypothetical protein